MKITRTPNDIYLDQFESQETLIPKEAWIALTPRLPRTNEEILSPMVQAFSPENRDVKSPNIDPGFVKTMNANVMLNDPLAGSFSPAPQIIEVTPEWVKLWPVYAIFAVVIYKLFK